MLEILSIFELKGNFLTLMKLLQKKKKKPLADIILYSEWDAFCQFQHKDGHSSK
jgi:hypothetical protein